MSISIVGAEVDRLWRTYLFNCTIVRTKIFTSRIKIHIIMIIKSLRRM